MRQNLFIFLLYILIFWEQYVTSQRTSAMRQHFQEEINEKKNSFFNGDSAQNFVRNYAGDQEADMTVPEIIEHWNYPVEIHQAVTSDGYILELHRIPFGRNDNLDDKQRPVVFLQHGLLCTSSVWVMNLPNQSAAFLFADAGFDVWMGNMRGNLYSRNHLQKNINPTKYWSFSWDEMARYDIEAMTNYVLNSTKQESLYYVGHSQGTLTMFSKLSLNDGFNKKIKKFFAIAPVATISHVKGMFRYLGEQFYDQLLLLNTFFGDQEFLPNTVLSRFLTEFVCGLYSNNPLCENFLFLVSGPDSMQLNKTRIGIYLAHNPAGTSLRNILHYCQMVRNKRMQAFDYGQKGNIEHYKMLISPEYFVNNIENVSIHLYYSDSDWLATSADIEGYLIKWLKPNTLAGVHKLNFFNHNDFLWGMRAADEVYWPIIYEIQNDLSVELKKEMNLFTNTNLAASNLTLKNDKKKNEESFGFKTITPSFSLMEITEDIDLISNNKSPPRSKEISEDEIELLKLKKK